MKLVLKEIIKRTPVLGKIARRLYWTLKDPTKLEPFPGSAEYWEKRYAAGATSGTGSYGLLAEFKAEVLNEFVATHDVQTVIEFGCGDGNQLRLARYPHYIGYDVSSTAVAKCRASFNDSTKSFRFMDEYGGEKADLVLSLDVIYHLVEDTVFVSYMRTLFAASDRYVCIYSSDTEDNRGYEDTHVRHRKFTKWVQEQMPGWVLEERRPNRYPYRGDHRKGSYADFYFYTKRDQAVKQ